VKNKYLYTDTTISSVNPADPTGNLALVRVGGKSRGADEDELKDSDRDAIGRADIDRSRVARAVARRQSMPNGEWAIRDADDLRQAVAKFLNPPDTQALSNTYGAGEIQRHIIQRARELQMAGTLPESWGISQEDDALRLMLDSIDVVNDDEMIMTADELIQANRFFSARQRRKYASQGVALPDGSFPIPDRDALRRAVRSAGRGGSYTRAKRHIIKRAKALGATTSLPDKWTTAEDYIPDESIEVKESSNKKFVTAEALQSILVLDGSDNAPFPIILEDKTTEPGGGFAKIKVPFYVGESLSKAPGFSQKILFPTDLLPSVIAEGKNQITDGRQPLTVYPRHKIALDGSDLPIGGVVDLVQEGRIGYGIIDVVNKGKGEQAIALMKHKDAQGRPQPLLNAISLRAGPGRFEMESIEMEDSEVLKVTKLHLDGVDFAPDSPAMKTYGIEFLAAESRSVDNNHSKEDKTSRQMSGSLTLETLKTQHRPLLEEIEAPFHDKIAELTQEISVLNSRIGGYEQREARRELQEYFQLVVDGLPVDLKGERKAVLQEIMAECKSKAEFNDRIMPIILTGLDRNRKPIESAEDRLRRLFSINEGKGRPGAAVTAETVGGGDANEVLDDGREMVGPLEVPSTSGAS
jgi:hypothetical protein